MKASVGSRCPKCLGRLSRDKKNRGWVRHLHRLPNGVRCDAGKPGEKD